MKGAAVGFLLAGLAALVGTVLVVRATQPRIDEAWASASWPTAQGEIVELRSGRNIGTHLRYRYEVAGRTYESGRVRLVEKAWADNRKQVAERYPEGATVSVAYDPQRPERAVLEPGTSWPAVAKKYIAGLFLGCVGVGLLAIGFSGLRG